MPRLYDSKAWLTRKYVVDKMDPAAIAKICGCTEMTIYRKLNEFGLVKKR